MYRVFGTVVHLAMSGDATCRGIRSERDGPLAMEFTKGTYLDFTAIIVLCQQLDYLADDTRAFVLLGARPTQLPLYTHIP